MSAATSLFIITLSWYTFNGEFFLFFYLGVSKLNKSFIERHQFAYICKCRTELKVLLTQMILQKKIQQKSCVECMQLHVVANSGAFFFVVIHFQTSPADICVAMAS